MRNMYRGVLCVVGKSFDIKTNMRHIHTSIVSRHLATRGNKKYCTHLHHTLGALKRDFPVSLIAPFPNSDKQISLPQIILIQSPGQITSITTMPPLQYTHTHHLFNCTHICTTLSSLDLWTDPAGVMELLARWRDMLAGGPKAG